MPSPIGVSTPSENINAIIITKRKDPIEESYSELLLFTAWRDELKELKPYNPKACLEEYAKRQGTWARGQMQSWEKINPKNLSLVINNLK